MPAIQFTLVGHYVPGETEAPKPLFIHVLSATSADDATAQFARVWPWSAVVTPFAGHLEALDGKLPLLLSSDGDLAITDDAAAALVANRRLARAAGIRRT